MRLIAILIVFGCLSVSGQRLFWDRSPDERSDAHYNVYQSTSETNWSVIGQTETNSFDITDYQRAGTSFRYKVTYSRDNFENESDPSNTIGVRGPSLFTTSTIRIGR